MALLDDLKWRYATKKMNGRTIPQDKLNYILEAARFAPSSSGLQQYKVIVISDSTLLERIKHIADGQEQISDCSHLLVWIAWDGYSDERISDVFKKMMDLRNLPGNTMDAYRQKILRLFEGAGKEWQAHHAAKQSYISFAMAIAAAAEQRVDATPMEGFDSNKLDELLRLKEIGYKSTVILPLGYRDEENDWLVNMKKFRTPKSQFVLEMRMEDVEYGSVAEVIKGVLN